MVLSENTWKCPKYPQILWLIIIFHIDMAMGSISDFHPFPDQYAKVTAWRVRRLVRIPTSPAGFEGQQAICHVYPFVAFEWGKFNANSWKWWFYHDKPWFLPSDCDVFSVFQTHPALPSTWAYHCTCISSLCHFCSRCRQRISQSCSPRVLLAGWL